MRPLLALILCVLAVGSTVPWWCPGTPLPPGTPRLAVGGCVTFDPLQASSLDEFRVLDALYEGLVRLDPATLRPMPALATSWQCATDGLTWTFALGTRSWSDGTPVTAAQVATGFARHRAGSASGSLLHGVAEVTAVDERTVRLVTTSPMPWLPAVLATPVFIPWHPAMDLPQAWIDPERFVTNGPLRCRDQVPRHHLDLVPSPSYCGPLPACGAVRLLVVDDAGTAVRLYLDHRVDAVLRLTTDTVSDLLRARAMDLQRSPSWGTEFYRVRVGGARTAVPLELRRALAAGIDRTALVTELLGGNGTPARGLIPPSAAELGYVPAPAPSAPAPLAPDSARPQLELVVPANQAERLRIAEWLCDRWRRTLGIDVTLVAVPGNQAMSRTKALDYDLSRGSLVGDYLDPAYFLDCFRAGSGMNRTGYDDPEFERLLSAAAADPQHRLELLAQAEQRLLASAAIIPLYHYACVFLVAPDVQGIQANALELVHYAAVERSAK
jgi:ABC-type oligopeptide transport system substrate-binding subunit